MSGGKAANYIQGVTARQSLAAWRAAQSLKRFINTD
jgi:hypothetical protein